MYLHVQALAAMLAAIVDRRLKSVSFVTYGDVVLEAISFSSAIFALPTPVIDKKRHLKLNYKYSHVS